MPQVQVISRQPDQAAESISKFGSTVAESVRAAQLLKLESLKLKDQMRNTDSEIRKAELEQRARNLDNFAKIQPIIANLPEEEKLHAVKNFFGDNYWDVLDSTGKVLSYKDPNQAIKERELAQKDQEIRLRGQEGRLEHQKLKQQIRANQPLAELRTNKAKQAALTANFLQEQLNQMHGAVNNPAQNGVSSEGQFSVQGNPYAIKGFNTETGGLDFVNLNAVGAEAAARKRGEMSVPQPITDTEMKDIKTQTQNIGAISDNVKDLVNNKDIIEKYLGPAIGPAGYNRLQLSYQNTPEAGLVSSILNSLGQNVQQYRVAITGAGAGNNELQRLEALRPSKGQPYNQILANSYLTTKTTINALKRQIPVLKSSNRDVSSFEPILNEAQDSLELIKKQLNPEVVKKLDSQWKDYGFIQAGQGYVNSSNQEVPTNPRAKVINQINQRKEQTQANQEVDSNLDAQVNQLLDSLGVQ